MIFGIITNALLAFITILIIKEFNHNWKPTTKNIVWCFIFAKIVFIATIIEFSIKKYKRSKQ